MPGPTGAGDKADIPPPLLIKYLSGDIPTDKPWIQGASCRARSEKQLCEPGNRVLCPRQRVTVGKTPKLKKNKSAEDSKAPLLCFFLFFVCFIANNTQVCLETAQNSNDMRNSRNSGVYLYTNFSVMTSSVQYYVTALQIIKTGIYICWIE